MNLLKKKLYKWGVDEEKIGNVFRKEKKRAKTILEDEDKTQKLVDAVLNLCDKLSRLPVIGEAFHDLPMACMMVSDYIHGSYREVPLATIITLTGAFGYFFSPLNLISNAIPVAGWLDDAVVFKLALQAAQNDLNAYEEWKAMQVEYCEGD